MALAWIVSVRAHIVAFGRRRRRRRRCCTIIFNIAKRYRTACPVRVILHGHGMPPPPHVCGLMAVWGDIRLGGFSFFLVYFVDVLFRRKILVFLFVGKMD